MPPQWRVSVGSALNAVEVEGSDVALVDVNKGDTTDPGALLGRADVSVLASTACARASMSHTTSAMLRMAAVQRRAPEPERSASEKELAVKLSLANVASAASPVITTA